MAIDRGHRGSSSTTHDRRIGRTGIHKPQHQRSDRHLGGPLEEQYSRSVEPLYFTRTNNSKSPATGRHAGWQPLALSDRPASSSTSIIIDQETHRDAGLRACAAPCARRLYGYPRSNGYVVGYREVLPTAPRSGWPWHTAAALPMIWALVQKS